MEYIILEPLESDNPLVNTSLIERKYEITKEEESFILHESGGPFTGFIVKKPLPLALQGRLFNLDKCDLSFKLNVIMKNSNQPLFHEEQRVLQFWFVSQSHADKMTCSNSFFHNLLKGDFPKDYFLFLLKIMQIVKGLKNISKLKIDIEKLGTPRSMTPKLSEKDPKQYAEIVSNKILEFLERAFPNRISVEELAKLVEADTKIVYDFLRDLFSRGLVLYYDNGNTWSRNIINQLEEQTHRVMTINQQLTVSNEDQPSIAIITVNYYEKLAVDAMMQNKITFVRHRPEGESNVYTIGNIGEHRVISTKLPLLGRDQRSAKISSGNTTTRLLGIFQRIEHVFLVGCGGAVPHYSDYTKHPRRGDIIVSFPDLSPENSVRPDEAQDFVYSHFELQKTLTSTQLVNKTWMPVSMELYKIVNDIRKSYDPSLNEKYPWEIYLDEGIKSLSSVELDCQRPLEDKLYLTIGDKNIIEARHPESPQDTLDRRQYGLPVLKFGKIAGGDAVVKDEYLRHLVSEQYGINCFDTDVDQVMESIDGNRKDSFIVIRGITDYVDGTQSKEWQPYAALSAAAFAKTIIAALPPATQSDF